MTHFFGCWGHGPVQENYVETIPTDFEHFLQQKFLFVVQALRRNYLGGIPDEPGYKNVPNTRRLSTVFLITNVHIFGGSDFGTKQWRWL